VADLSNAVLSGAKNEYWGNDFRDADLTRANLAGLTLNRARFEHAILKFADLSGTQLVQADFTGADLTGTSFTDANIESALFSYAGGLSSAQREQLEQRAQRWKFELSNYLSSLFLPASILVVFALCAVSLASHSKSNKKHPSWAYHLEVLLGGAVGGFVGQIMVRDWLDPGVYDPKNTFFLCGLGLIAGYLPGILVCYGAIIFLERRIAGLIGLLNAVGLAGLLSVLVVEIIEGIARV